MKRAARSSRLRRPAAPLALLAAGLTGGAVALAAGRAADRRAVAADPEHDFLRDPPRGRARTLPGAGGCRIHVEEFGAAGAPPVVLIHGWTCHLRFWAYQLRDLARDHRVIAYDLRGHGDSEAPENGDLSTDALADDLEAVLDACLAEGERALLVGHSLGAMTIAAWAGRHPDSVARRASGAILVNTGLGDLVSQATVLRLPGPLDTTRQALARVVIGTAGPLPARNPVSHRLIRQIVMSPGTSPARVAFCENMILECRHDVRAGFGRTVSALELHDAVDRLTVPSWVIAGERDRLTPMALSERLAGDLPDLRELVRLPETGHMGPVEQSEAVTRVIAEAARAAATASV